MVDTASVATKEIGTSSRGWTSGADYLALDDRYAGLRSDRWFRTVREMVEDDPTVGAVMYAIEMMIRRVSWNVEPPDDSPAAKEVADFVETCREDLDGTWPDVIADILAMFPYGYSLMEIVYKRRGGDVADPTQRSMYDDGKIGWRKFAYRPPETKVEWIYDQGDVVWWKQRVPMGPEVVIPRNKFLLFTTTARYGQAEGVSVLRRAYLPWYHKKELQTAEAIGVYRDLAGMPLVRAPSKLFTSDDPDDMAAFAEYTRIIKNTHAGAQSGLMIPSDLWEDADGNPVPNSPQYEFKLVNSGGAKQFNTNEIIMRYRTDIAMALLADVILIGHETTGTYATGVSKAKLFLQSLAAALDAIAEEITVNGIRQLVKLNGWSVELAPRLDHSDPEQADIEGLGKFLVAMSTAGLLGASPELERFLLELVGLPAPAEDEKPTTTPAPAPEPEITPAPTPDPAAEREAA